MVNADAQLAPRVESPVLPNQGTRVHPLSGRTLTQVLTRLDAHPVAAIIATLANVAAWTWVMVLAFGG